MRLILINFQNMVPSTSSGLDGDDVKLGSLSSMFLETMDIIREKDSNLSNCASWPVTSEQVSSQSLLSQKKT